MEPFNPYLEWYSLFCTSHYWKGVKIFSKSRGESSKGLGLDPRGEKLREQNLFILDKRWLLSISDNLLNSAQGLARLMMFFFWDDWWETEKQELKQKRFWLDIKVEKKMATDIIKLKELFCIHLWMFSEPDWVKPRMSKSEITADPALNRRLD